MNQEIHISEYIWTLLIFIVIVTSIVGCCCWSCYKLCFKSSKKQFYDREIRRMLENSQKLETSTESLGDLESQTSVETSDTAIYYEDEPQTVGRSEEESIKQSIYFGNTDSETLSHEETDPYEEINRGEETNTNENLDKSETDSYEEISRDEQTSTNKSDILENLERSEEQTNNENIPTENKDTYEYPTYPENVDLVKDNMNFESEPPRYEEVSEQQYEDIANVGSSSQSSSYYDELDASKDANRKESLHFRKENIIVKP